MDKPGVYGPMPFRPSQLPGPVQQPAAPEFPPHTFPHVKPHSRVAAPTYGASSESYTTDFSEAETQLTEPGTEIPGVDPDPYVDCPLVPGLNQCTFWPFINNLDAKLVRYYDPCDVRSGLAKLQIPGVSQIDVISGHYIAACVVLSSQIDVLSSRGIAASVVLTTGTQG